MHTIILSVFCLHPAVTKFVNDIKNMYKGRYINCEGKRPRRNSDKVIELKLVWRKGYFYTYLRDEEDRVGQQVSISYCDLFTEYEDRKVKNILVEGDSGIGKTYLCTSLAEGWAKGDLLQQYDMLLLLPLRLKNVVSAHSLSQWLSVLHNNENVCSCVEEWLTRNRGKNLLIILDGWDELSESTQMELSSPYLYKLLFNPIDVGLLDASVLLTSRPSASASLHDSHIDRFIEVHGFSKESIRKYIESEFAANSSSDHDLLKQLKNYPLIESVCHIPLICSILCQIWQVRHEPFPTTMTELYKKMILNHIYCNINVKHTDTEILELLDFDDLPSNLQDPWQCLCQFAYNTKATNQFIFYMSELSKIGYDKKILPFGLLQSNEKMLAIGSGQIFHFLHSSFHEFLAALHLAKSSDDFFKFSSEIFSPSRDFGMVLEFFVGIYCQKVQKERKEESTTMECTYFDTLEKLLSKIKDKSCLCRCAFEAKHPKIYSMVISLLSGSSDVHDNDLPLIDFGYSRTTYDCDAVIDIICNIKEKIHMVIKFSGSGVRESQIEMLTKAPGFSCQELQVVTLDLSSNQLSDKSVSNLFNNAPSAFKSLELLDLSANKIGCQSVHSITAALKESCNSLSTLMYLNLSENPLQKFDFQELERAIKKGMLANLSELNLQKSLTDDANTNGCIIDTFVAALLKYCHKFKHLDLSYNTLGKQGALALASQCKEDASKLFLLGLNGTELGNAVFTGSLNSVDPYDCLQALQLMNNNITAIDVKHLADHFSKKIVVEDCINLDNNPLGLKGAFYVGRMLSSTNCVLNSLTLSGCQLTSGSGRTLTSKWGQLATLIQYGCQLLPGMRSHKVLFLGCEGIREELCQMFQCQTLSRLNVNNNDFNGDGISILAGFLYLCPCLKSLKCSDCGITSNDIITLLNQLDKMMRHKKFLYQPCKKLEEWVLNNNNIDIRGKSALKSFQSSSLSPSLKILLDNNPVYLNKMVS